jgi:hypothetical protein
MSLHTDHKLLNVKAGDISYYYPMDFKKIIAVAPEINNKT